MSEEGSDGVQDGEAVGMDVPCGSLWNVFPRGVRFLVCSATHRTSSTRQVSMFQCCPYAEV